MRLPLLLGLLLASACAGVRPSPALRLDETRAIFPTEVADRVGLSEERFTRLGIAEPGAAPEVALELDRRTLPLASCAPRGRALFATFLVDADGKAFEPVAATLPPDAEAEACVVRELRIGRFGATPGFFWTGLLLGPGASGKLRAGWEQPRPVGARCEHTVRLPAEVVQVPQQDGFRLGARAMVFLIRADGSVTHVHADGPIPERWFALFRSSVEECRWAPAKDADGNAQEVWASLPIVVR